jgi:pyruvate formate lyase activating enzyme
MNIGGFQKNSLIDFPGTIACVIFTQGCNFACPYCHNPGLVPGPQKGVGDACDEQTIFAFLEKRKEFIDGVVITGGEPTLQKDLETFCRKIKAMGYKVKLDSNGSHPGVLSRLFKEKLVDFVAMDIKTSLENYPLLTNQSFDTGKITESIRLIKESAPDYEFRTTCCKPFITTDIMHDMGKMLNHASKFVLQNCSRNVTMLDPDFFKPYCLKLKSNDIFFSEEQTLELKEIMNNYVETSLIR